MPSQKMRIVDLLEETYKLCDKIFTVNLRFDFKGGSIQCNFTYPPSDRVSEDRLKKREKELEAKRVLAGK